MPLRVTLKAVNDELARQGYTTPLAKVSGLFQFYKRFKIDLHASGHSGAVPTRPRC